MIERGFFFLPSDGDFPPMIGRERSVLDCGCTVYCGIRVDKREVATAATACSGRHAGLMDEANFAILASLGTPEARPLVEVVDEILTEVAGRVEAQHG